MSYINSIGTAVPKYKNAQSDVAEYMIRKLSPITGDDEKRIRLLYERSSIKSRYSVLPDFIPGNESELFVPSKAEPGISERMKKFQEYSLPLSIDAVKDCVPEKEIGSVDYLISVSCTGLSAPGLEIDILQELNLPLHTPRTSVNFMGCYAAFHALRMADQIIRSGTAKNVLIVCIELCTLHFQNSFEADHIVANSLFGDGAAAILVSSENKKGLKISGFHSEILPQGKKDMAWHLAETGFIMTLSSFIPGLVEEGLSSLLNNALAKFNIEKKKILHWAIHPGGRKILEAVQKTVGMERSELDISYNVLQNFGNMSSPTVVFVLKDLIQKLSSHEKGEHIFSAGFGPGLSLESAIFETT